MNEDWLYYVYTSYIDVLLFVVISFLTWLCFDCFRLRRRTDFVFRLCVFVTIGSLTGFSALVSWQLGNFQKHQLRASIAGFAPTYAIEIQHLNHGAIRDSSDRSSPEFVAISERQAAWRTYNPAAQSIYTLRRGVNNTVDRIVDSHFDSKETDIARDDSEELREDEPHGKNLTIGMREAFQGQSVFDDVPIKTDRGIWISAYAPIYRSDGSVDAILGVDFSASEWIANVVVGRAVVLSIAFAVILGLIGSIGFNAAIRHQLGLTQQYGMQLQEQAETLQAANSELSLARDAANQASRTKSDFLANMSHEIRTPMNGIMGLTELLLNTELEADQRRNLELIRSSADALMTVLNDILDFSKIEANKLTLDPHTFDLRDMLGDAMKLFGMRAHHKQIELAFRIAPEVPNSVIGDAGRIRQVLVNLVGNAIKFTHEGEVVVSIDAVPVDDDACRLKFHVRDTGIGIDKSQLARLFEPFNQADNSTTRKYGGTGLGLTICQRLIELMGGQLRMDSAPGVGTSVTFELTCARPIATADALAIEEQLSLDNIRVLVVDDNSTNLLILKEMLASWRVEATSLDSGAEVVRVLEQAYDQGKPFDLVLTDLQMPEVDGFATTELIRRSSKVRETRVIVLSSCDASAFSEQVKELELSAYLTKPIKQSELLECILSVLKRSRPTASRSQFRISSSSGGQLKKPLRPLKVLVAEDNYVNQQLIYRVLSKAGHDVALVNHGLEAVEYLAVNSVDIVLMDCQMPTMDGYAATGEIRKAGRLARCGSTIPIVALTANAMRGDREKCLAAGMDDYASKPIQFAKLFDVIAGLVPEHAGTENETVANGATGPDSDSQGIDSSIFSTESLPVLDRNELRDRIDGDLELLAILLEAFDRDVSHQLRELESKVEAGHWEDARRIAHSIKGTAANLGGSRVATAAAALERQLTIGQRPEAKFVQSFMIDTSALCEELRQVVAQQRF